MSDWGGPYVAAMLTLSADADGSDRSPASDDGATGIIRGVANHGFAARIDEIVSFRLMVILYQGNRGPTDRLLISIKPPKSDLVLLPPVTFEYGDSPIVPAEVQVRIDLPVIEFGVYWIRAQIQNRMLSRIPMEIRQLSPIPDVFERSIP